jgi:hypothetical protein
MASTSWLMDATPPTSMVDSLPSDTTSSTFVVSVTASDPNGSGGSTPSGVASIAIYVSTNGGPYVLFTTVSPSRPSAVFQGQTGDTYAFYSIATDEAGNVQPTSSVAQTTTTVISPSPPTGRSHVKKRRRAIPHHRRTTGKHSMPGEQSVSGNSRCRTPGEHG